MKQELRSSLGRPYLTIDTDMTNRWVLVEWAGYLTAESIKAGAQAYIDAVAASGLRCVLNDTRKVIGPWDHSMDWILNEWAPNATAAGIRHFAMVSVPDSMADASAASFYAQLKGFEVRIFGNDDDAKAWLRTTCGK
ncbi:STAS/SEC14 domain-containing protein [Hymenobacter lucidus]|uniref:STAS/SEC14 domain-containing protein n=1 Tax=Hymenobacter lucidus TaxID=2880930 RepID=A0ABS8AVL1_9BACT|nr:STAS/SEC14 domain-containing protein [Hymenobacter lucidus]MCB2409539.1 STAS/SEC14 domain-containing protein [Hymenobacter lucidus]